MRIDTHVHTSGVSLCGQVSPENMVKEYAAAGYGAVILTNHYNYQQMSTYGATWKARIGRYLKEYFLAKNYGEKEGVKVFLGAEVALRLPDCNYAEFMLYGLTESVLLDFPELYRYSQKELFDLAERFGLLMVQTHPYRDEHGHFPHDPHYMHGVEINCHPMFFRHEDKVRAFAKKHKLLVTCGSDYHYAGQAGRAGMIVPDELSDAVEFAAYLRENHGAEIFYT